MSAPVLAFRHPRPRPRQDDPPILRKVALVNYAIPEAVPTLDRLLDLLLDSRGYTPGGRKEA